MKRCLFFDRDGVINQSPGEGRYVLSVEDFILVPEIAAVLRELKSRGWLVVLVTSQKCVGKGVISEDELTVIHQYMQSELGVGFDGIYAYTGDGKDRFGAKPDPGMMFLAADELGIDLGMSWLVGDADRDIEMGKRAGVGRTVRFVSEKPIGVGADYQVESALELLALLRRSAFHPDGEQGDVSGGDA